MDAQNYYHTRDQDEGNGHCEHRGLLRPLLQRARVPLMQCLPQRKHIGCEEHINGEKLSERRNERERAKQTKDGVNPRESLALGKGAVPLGHSWNVSDASAKPTNEQRRHVLEIPAGRVGCAATGKPWPFAIEGGRSFHPGTMLVVAERYRSRPKRPSKSHQWAPQRPACQRRAVPTGPWTEQANGGAMPRMREW